MNHYNTELVNMYNITATIIQENYPGVKIDWGSNEIFNDFTILIYERSSKAVDAVESICDSLEDCSIGNKPCEYVLELDPNLYPV